MQDVINEYDMEAYNNGNIPDGCCYSHAIFPGEKSSIFVLNPIDFIDPNLKDGQVFVHTILHTFTKH